MEMYHDGESNSTKEVADDVNSKTDIEVLMHENFAETYHIDSDIDIT